jgi:hypothetical protein
MTCYNPMRAWWTGRKNPDTGKEQLTFNRNNGIVDRPIDLPCGKCMGCRVKYSISWALRCVHESQDHEHNSFITLTYDDDHLPKGGTLVKKHFVDFMKRLRRKLEPTKIRYFMCGEYGDKFQRPHYHALIFGYDFPDKVEFKYRKNSILYTSDELAELWPFGFVTVGELTYESASYTAQYATKKIRGELADQIYGDRVHPYITMSRNPGLGTNYFNKYKKELFQHDSIVHNGRSFPLPRFYTELFSEEEIKQLKQTRQENIKYSENTIERLRVREEVKEANLKLRNRDYE